MSKKIPIKRFSFRVLVFSVVMTGLTVLFQIFCPQLASPALPFIVLFFMFVTLFTLFIVLRDDQAKAEKRFVSSYLLSRIIKLFSCLLFVVLYVLINRSDAWRFAIAFLVIYFIYSVFEVIVLKKESDDLSQKNKKEQE